MHYYKDNLQNDHTFASSLTSPSWANLMIPVIMTGQPTPFP